MSAYTTRKRSAVFPCPYTSDGHFDPFLRPIAELKIEIKLNTRLKQLFLLGRENPRNAKCLPKSHVIPSPRERPQSRTDKPIRTTGQGRCEIIMMQSFGRQTLTDDRGLYLCVNKGGKEEEKTSGFREIVFLHIRSVYLAACRGVHVLLFDFPQSSNELFALGGFALFR